MATERRRSFARGVGWSTAGGIVSQGTAILASVAFARLLGTELYGVFGFLQGTVLTAVLLLGQPVALTATRFAAALRERDLQRTGRVIGLLALVTWGIAITALVVAVLGAHRLATAFLHDPRKAFVVGMAAVIFIGNLLNATQQGLLAGLDAFRDIARLNLARALVFPAAVAAAALSSLEGTMLVLALAGLAPAVYGAALVRQQLRAAGIRVCLRGAWRERAVFASFTLPALAASLVTLPVMWLGTVILLKAPQGLAELALFNAANNWRYPVQFLPGMLASPFLTALSRADVAGDDRLVRRTLGYAVLANLAASLAPALVIAAAAAPIMAAYGPTFIEGVDVLRILLLATVLNALASSLLLLLSARSRMSIGLGLNCLFTLVFLGLLARGWAMTADGLAYAHLVSYSVLVISCASVSFWLLRFQRGVVAVTTGTR